MYCCTSFANKIKPTRSLVLVSTMKMSRSQEPHLLIYQDRDKLYEIQNKTVNLWEGLFSVFLLSLPPPLLFKRWVLQYSPSWPSIHYVVPSLQQSCFSLWDYKCASLYLAGKGTHSSICLQSGLMALETQSSWLCLLSVEIIWLCYHAWPFFPFQSS